jgi:hypothetical protein
MIVHVVSWEYYDGGCGGGGFNWYRHEGAAIRAFDHEKHNVRDFLASNWEAVRYSFDTGDVTDPDGITCLINDKNSELFDTATIRVSAKSPATV